MATLASVRYRDTIVRLRYPDGAYDGRGRWVRGEAEETELRAAVQPVALEDSDMQEGARLVERLRVYVPASSGDLRAAADDTVADRVEHGGEVYTVAMSRTWPGHHTRAVLERAAPEPDCPPYTPDPDPGALPFL